MGTEQRRPARRAAWIAVLLVALSVSAGASAAQAAAPGSAEEELADRYAPVMALQEHTAQCGPGEAFMPAPVDAVLGQADVVLRADDGSVMAAAPTAADLGAAPPEAYLDIPGNALNPGCAYEEFFASTGAAATPTVYARVVTDADEPGRLAVQYWVFWIYNDWNNRHEGDWEMLQVAFEAASAEEALTVAPVEVAVAQHEGSERRAWDRVQRDGDRPVVYPATGSHATFYTADRWFGKDGQSGFGCDDTRAPSTRVDPAVVMIPDDLSADPSFAWLTFEGRWGERQRSFNNGPTGPNMKDQWEHPIVWMEEEGRTASVSLPPLGTRVTDFFCSASTKGSLAFIRFMYQPWLVAAAVVALVALIVVGVRRTLWSPDLPLPLVQRRRNGQIMRGAARLVFEQRRRYLPIGLFLLGAGLLATVVQQLVLRVPLFDTITDVVGRDNSSSVGLALLAGSLVTIPAAIHAHAASVKLAGEIDAGTTAPGILRRTWGTRTLWSGALFVLLLVVLVPVLLLDVIVAVLWCVASSVADRDGTGVRASFRESRRLGRGHRLRVLVLVVVVTVVAVFTGPLVGTLVLIVSSLSFVVVNVIAAVFIAFLLPWMSVALRLLHGDLVAAQRE